MRCSNRIFLFTLTTCLFFNSCEYYPPVHTARVFNGKIDSKNFRSLFIVQRTATHKYANQNALLANASTGGNKIVQNYDLYMANYLNKKIKYIKRIEKLSGRWYFSVNEIKDDSIIVEVYRSRFSSIIAEKIQVFFTKDDVSLNSRTSSIDEMSKFTSRNDHDSRMLVETFKLDEEMQPIWINSDK